MLDHFRSHLATNLTGKYTNYMIGRTKGWKVDKCGQGDRRVNKFLDVICEWSLAPEHAVRPGGDAALLGGVVDVGEDVVLVGGREGDRSLLEPGERPARRVLVPQL